MAAAWLLSSCVNLMPPSYQPTPETIRPGCPSENVRAILGEPDWAEPFEVRNPKTGALAQGSVWHYTDHWWKKQGWGSWDVYLDADRRYAGWRLTSPSSAEPNDREVFFALPLAEPPPAVSQRSGRCVGPSTSHSRIVPSPTYPKRGIDVTGFKSGEIAVDPYTGKPFRVP